MASSSEHHHHQSEHTHGHKQLFKQRNKPRLYVSIYPSGNTTDPERKFHWAFLVGPKHEGEGEVPGTRYHVKNHPSRGWHYEKLALTNVRDSTSLLLRIVIGKVENLERFEEILASIPVRHDDPDWRCRTWMRNVVDALRHDQRANPAHPALGTAVLDWDAIERKGREYHDEKVREGRYNPESGQVVMGAKPVYDMIERREVSK